MNEPNQKPSIEEQYAVALSCGTQRSVVLAMGLTARNDLDARAVLALMHLRAEYDAVRSELERSGQIAPNRAPDRRALEQRIVVAKRDDNLDAVESLQLALERFEKRTEAEIKTARAVILVALPGLHTARQELGALAVRMGASPKRALSPSVALQLAARVLDVWLDDVCHKCDGTGRIGNRYVGERERECTACKGGGSRRVILGDSLRETAFARDLQAEIDRLTKLMLSRAAETIHADSGPSKPMHPELVRRLAELRGVDAAAD